MNIDSSNILNLLSSADSMENIQQSFEVQGVEGNNFAETFKNTIHQLDELSQKIHLSDGTSQYAIDDSTNALHGIADLINEMGNDLPVNKPLVKQIDLDNTLESLEDVIYKLDDIAETGQRLENKITEWVKTVESIQLSVESIQFPEDKNSGLSQSLNQIVDDLKVLNEQVVEQETQEPKKDVVMVESFTDVDATRPKEIENTHLTIAEEANNKTLDDTNDKTLEGTNKFQKKSSESYEKEVSEKIDIIAKSIEQIKEETVKVKSPVNLNIVELESEVEDLVNLNIVELKSEIENLQTEVGNINEMFSQKLKENELHNKNSNQLLREDLDRDIQEDKAPSNQQTTEIINLLTQTSEQLKPVVDFEIIDSALQIPKPDSKTENLWLKQIADEKTLNSEGKIETDSFLEQENKENTLKKPTQESPVIFTKQLEKQELSGENKLDVGSEKSLPKMVNDLAILSRVVERENKAELPPMTKHFSHPEWNKEMGEKVIWMHKQEIPSAELRLNPKHLGPVTIKVDVTKDQATVVFTAQHAAVKEAIESAIPKLKEMFSTQQLNLVEVNVSQENPDQRQSRGFNQMAYGQNKQGHQDGTEATEKQAQDESLMDVTEEIEAGRAIASNGILSIFA